MSANAPVPDDGATLSALATEQVNAATTMIDRMTPLEIVAALNAEDATVAGAVAQESAHIATAIAAIATRLRQGGRLIYLGAGTSGRLGALDAVECPPTFSIPPDRIIGCIAGGSFALTQAAEDYEDDAEAGRSDVAQLNIGANDVLVGITASGRTPYVLGAVTYARTQGTCIIGLACNAGSPLAALADIMIAPVVGPEAISGSTRLKAGTAQKMVLNMLSTGAMVLLGKTFGNLMVDVQPTNAKLHQRALAVTRQGTGLDDAAATALLDATGGEVKTAILAHRAAVTPEQARAQLLTHQGSLRAALDERP